MNRVLAVLPALTLLACVTPTRVAKSRCGSTLYGVADVERYNLAEGLTLGALVMEAGVNRPALCRELARWSVYAHHELGPLRSSNARGYTDSARQEVHVKGDHWGDGTLSHELAHVAERLRSGRMSGFGVHPEWAGNGFDNAMRLVELAWQMGGPQP